MLGRTLILTAFFVLTVNAITLVSREVAASDLPVGARCSTSDVCHTGYCGKSRCLAPKSEGEPCYKNAGCSSNYCDRKTNKCAWQTAADLIDETEPIVEGTQYVQNGPIFLGQATLKGLGSINIQDVVTQKAEKNTPRIAAQLSAKSTEPAVMRTLLATPSEAEDDSGLFYRFRVSEFHSSRKRATCHLSTTFNGKALSLPITVHKTSESYQMASYTLAPDAQASSVSILLRCDRFATATVLISDLRIEVWKGQN
jgi:hypothetical protein